MSSIVNAKKIFVDPSEEITFLVEKVLSAGDSKIVLVIPENSLIFSSLISLKILYHTLSRAGKAVVIVTEDKFGISSAQRVGYITVTKVSQISNELWEVAKNRQSAYINSLKDREKSNLLNPDTNQVEDEIEIRESEMDIQYTDTEQIPDSEQEIIKEGMEEAREEEWLEEDSIARVESTSEAESDTMRELSISEEKNTYKDPEQEKFEKDAEKIINLNSAKAAENKLVSKGNVNILVGGDIRSPKNNAKIDAMSDRMNLINKKDAGARSSFIGKDLTREIPTKKNNFLRKLFYRKQPKNVDDRLDGVSLSAGKKGKKIKYKRVIIAFLFIFILSNALMYIYLLTSVKANVRIQFTKSDVEVLETIDADPTVTQIDYLNFVIPAKLLLADELSTSRTSDATGTAESGNKAKGFVTIYNTTEERINLPTGTKVRSVGTGLEYIIEQDVILEEADVTAESVTNPSIEDDVPVIAVNIGPEYNIAGTTENVQFEVEGYAGTNDVYARRFRAFEGGTKEKFESVSRENLDTLKATIIPELESQGEKELKTLVPSNYILIEDSIKFEETKLTSVPNVGEKVTDGKFTLTVEGKVTGLAISEDDLENIVKYIIQNDPSVSPELPTENVTTVTQNGQTDSIGETIVPVIEEEQSVIESVEDIEITSVSRADNVVTFNVSSKGVVSDLVSEEEIINNLKGKTQEEAEDYLESVENIETYYVDITPSFAPGFMKKIPSDAGKIMLDIQ